MHISNVDVRVSLQPPPPPRCCNIFIWYISDYLGENIL